MCLLFLTPVDFISHIPWNTFIFSFLKEKKKKNPKPKPSEAPHPAPLSSAFSVLPPGLLILARITELLPEQHSAFFWQVRTDCLPGSVFIWPYGFLPGIPSISPYESITPQSSPSCSCFPPRLCGFFFPAPSRALCQHIKPGAALTLLRRVLGVQSPNAISVTALLGPAQCEMRNFSLTLSFAELLLADPAVVCAAGLQQHQRQEARGLHPGEIRDRDRHEHRHHLLQLPLL